MSEAAYIGQSTITELHPEKMTNKPLRDCVADAMHNYFRQLDGHPADNLYQMVLQEIEEPLFRSVLTYTKGNQSRASELLGINRGTLRKKLKQYGLHE